MVATDAGTPADGVQDGVEGKAGAEGGRAESGHRAVEQRCRPEPVEVLARQENERDVDERVETEIEEVRKGGDRRSRAALRFRSQGRISESPSENPEAEQERDGSLACGERSPQTQGARQEFECGDTPAVDERYRLRGTANEQRDQVCGKDEP